MEDRMKYRVFFTDVPVPVKYEPNYSQLIPLEYDTKELAIENAFKILELPNRIVWRIDGPSNFLMTRKDLENEYFRRTGKRVKY